MATAMPRAPISANTAVFLALRSLLVSAPAVIIPPS